MFLAGQYCPYCVKLTKFAQLTPMKITKFVVTRCHILRRKSTKFDFGCGSAPRPRWGSLQCSPDLLAGGEGGWLPLSARTQPPALSPAGLDSRTFGAWRFGSSLFTIQTLTAVMGREATVIPRRWVGTNLIHDFTAVTFSVKLAFFCEIRPFCEIP